MNILELMKERRIYFDGGMGSLLQARGLQPGELPETWNLSKPEIIEEIRKITKAGKPMFGICLGHDQYLRCEPF